MVGGGGMSKVDWSKAPEGAEFYAHKRFRRQVAGISKPMVYDEGEWQFSGFPYDSCLNATDYEPRPVSDPLNGYLWSVEYRVNGVKPNIPGDVRIRYTTCYDGTHGECQFKSIGWGEGHKTIKTIRIIDSRYAPAPPVPQWPDDEDRIDVVAQNGNTGEHYAQAKHDSDKPRYDLLPPVAIDLMAKVMTFGAKKYKPEGWRSVPDALQRYQAAMLRHAFAIQRGELIDTESGLPHAAHVMCCAAFIAELSK